MDCQVGRELPGEASQADVLNDQGINPSRCCRQDQVGGLVQLSGKHQNVERQETLDTPPVQPLHQLWQFLTLKVGGPHAGIQGINAEVHRIGPVGDSRLQRLPGAGGRKQFRQDSGHERVVMDGSSAGQAQTSATPGCCPHSANAKVRN